MARKDKEGERPGAAQPETMERSDEVAQNADAQGDGAPHAAEMEDNAGSSPAGDDGARREVAELRDRHLRLAAEYDNYRKRTARESAQAGARAQAELVRQLLAPLDDLMRFADLDPSAVDVPTVVQGVDLVERKMLKALGAAGLEILNPVDQPFNPEQHEAVATEPAASREDDDMVSRVYEKGYTFGGQLLRPARVVVKQWNG
jgi:molecular chaperone GrpE